MKLSKFFSDHLKYIPLLFVLLILFAKAHDNSKFKNSNYGKGIYKMRDTIKEVKISKQETVKDHKAPGSRGNAPTDSFHFNTFFVHRDGLNTETFDKFLNEARPQVVQIGYYGPQLHGYGDNPKAAGYPMHLTVKGTNNLLAFYKDINKRCHSLGLKVIGHFQIGKVIGNWDKQDDFINYYKNLWDEKLLGKKPVDDVREVLARNSNGEPIDRDRTAAVRYVGLCVSSPYCRQMLKQMLKVSIDAGVDGVMVNFNYRWSCVCRHCQASFKEYIKKKYSAQQTRKKFGINNLATHTFSKIDAEIPGFPDSNATAIDWEARRWGALQFKEAFDEVFIKYGRSLKRDLIIGTWNHIGNLGVKEERMFLPADLWGKDENYFWYSGIYEGTDFAKRQCGDGWLLSAYIREMANGKPHVLGKYERIRMRVSIAEGVATGGGGMGRYQDYLNEEGFKNIVQYDRWLNKHKDLYGAKRSDAEVGIILPRQAVLGGDQKGYDSFRTVGQRLAESQVLFDVISDEKFTPQRLSQYLSIVVPNPASLTAKQKQMIKEYGRKGKLVISKTGEQLSAEEALTQLSVVPNLSRINAPWTIRSSLWNQDGRKLLHLVNYLRDESGGKSRNKGPADERPISQKNIPVELRLLPGQNISSVTLLSPDTDEAIKLAFKQEKQRVSFTVPELLVYSVIRIDLAKKNPR